MDTFFMLLFAYLLGSVPIGILLGYIYGVDIRQAGSGNIGATNVARVVGKRQGLITLLGDAGKGFIPVFLSFQLGFSFALTNLVGLAAFLGHLYPIFLRFQGGKGVATALGVFLWLAPKATLVLVLVFSLVAVVSRVVSLASLIAAGLAPVIFWVFSAPSPLVWLSLFMALLIILRHRENIQRLISGVEPRFNL